MAIEMKIGDIHESAIVSVRHGLKHFLVGIILPAKADAWPVTLIGSGTLVSVQGRHYILTAAHVWSEVKKSKYFQLSFDDRKISFVARTDSVSVEVFRGDREAE